MYVRAALAALGIGLLVSGASSAQSVSSADTPSSSASSPSSAVTKPRNRINLTDPTGLAQAASSGDQDKLAFIASTTSNGPDVLAKALRERSLFKLDASSKTVADCGDLSRITHSLANVQCVSVLAGNKLLANDIAGWATLMEANKQNGYPLIAAAIGKQAHLDPHSFYIPEFEVVPDYTAFFAAPKVSVTRKADEFDVPLAWQVLNQDGNSLGIYMMTVLINGKPIRMVFDTGSSGIVLNPDDAKTAGVNPIDARWIPLDSGIHTTLGIVKSMDIGQLHLEHMPVSIPQKPLKYSLFGLSGMQYLGAFRLHGDTLYSTSKGFGTACQSPMDMAVQINGSNAMLVVRGMVQQKPFPFVVDSGSVWSLVKNHLGAPSSKDDPKAITLSRGGVEQYAWYSTDHDVLRIGDAPEQDQSYQVFYNTEPTRFRYELGTGYIRPHDLIADFDRGVLCMK